RSEEAPQSFDLYGSGQKVGGDISGGSEQVKGRWKPVSTIRRANWCSVSAFLRGGVRLRSSCCNRANSLGWGLENSCLSRSRAAGSPGEKRSRSRSSFVSSFVRK